MTHHAQVVAERHARGDGQGGVGHAADEVELRSRLAVVGFCQAGVHGARHLLEHVWVGDDDAQVDVDGGDESGLERELAELDGLLLV
jgi:hypothetical protein